MLFQLVDIKPLIWYRKVGGFTYSHVCSPSPAWCFPLSEPILFTLRQTITKADPTYMIQDTLANRQKLNDKPLKRYTMEKFSYTIDAGTLIQNHTVRGKATLGKYNTFSLPTLWNITALCKTFLPWQKGHRRSCRTHLRSSSVNGKEMTSAYTSNRRDRLYRFQGHQEVGSMHG